MRAHVEFHGIEVPSLSYVNHNPFPFLHTTPLAEFNDFKTPTDIVVIGQGGSVNSIRGVMHALEHKSRFHIVDSQDPVLLHNIKSSLGQHPLIIPISKSGTTSSVLQNTLYFNGLPMLGITDATSPLAQVLNSIGQPHVVHPEVGGRFVGNTLAGLLPAHIAGIDVGAIMQGGHDVYQEFYGPETANLAWQVASFLFACEEQHYTDIYVPVYDYRLQGFNLLVLQLMHETYGKQGRGQTTLALSAPEAQHHTNQRFFGGSQIMCAVVVSVRNGPKSHIFVPDVMRHIALGNGELGTLHGMSHQDALHAERDGVLTHMRHNHIPFVHVCLESVNASAVGYYMAFWQLVAAYSAQLRGADPLDQPEVEYAKKATKKILFG